ncbi:hypothetical protein [Bdellovibrio sp. BCCA]|uniref:hypothetical protein n=1 Tax=Bdellovibrio sp. BCCA TaxID=3136281 RepID=UPI0030F03373
MIRSLAIHFVFFFTLIISFGMQAHAQQTCGAQTCGEGYQCNVKNNPFSATVYRCEPIPGFDLQASRALSSCQASCTQEGYTCHADNSERTSYSCRPVAGSENRCSGPCRGGGSQVLVNGKCECPGDNNNRCPGGCQSGWECAADDNTQSGYACRPSQSQNSASCVQQYQQLKQKCDSEYSDASYTCDEKNDSGMADVTNTGAQLALMMGQQTSASIQAACSRMADFTQAANGALAAYRMTCNVSINSCKSACSDAKSYLTQNLQCVSENNQATASNLLSAADDSVKKCGNFDSKMNQAQQAIQNYGATSANASQCASLTSGTSGQVTEFCKANPTHVSCKTAGPVDCSNPTEATTNKVCVCIKNPNDPMCGVAQKAGGDAVGTPGTIDSSSRLASGNNSAPDFGGDIPGLPSITPGKPSSGSDHGVDGSQGGGTLSGGGSGGSAGGPSSGGGGGAAASEDKSVLGGFYGGGSGGRFGGGSYGGGSGGDGRGVGVGGANGAAGTPGGPDLRKFLPGGQFDPKRGISGMGGPDGITGPHSNIWQKIQNRYQVMSPTLLP